MVAALNLTDILASRGIAAACNDAEWAPHTYKGFEGWRYPVFNLAGQPYNIPQGFVYRWKNAEPQTESNKNRWQKYAWIPAKPDRAKYYLLPDTLQAIQDGNGVLYLASGEPDVMAYRAAGLRNALCWFDGERSLPDTLISDLERMQVRTVNLFPDRDSTGMAAAGRLHKLFEPSPLRLFVWQLPGDLGTKHDINWLWQSVGFNAGVFHTAIHSAPLIDSDTLSLYGLKDAPKGQTQPLFDTDRELPQSFKDALRRHAESRPGFKRWTSDGWANYKCDLHDDHAASAGFNIETMCFNCFVCGSFNARDYGEKIGIHLRDFYEPRNVVTLSASSRVDLSTLSTPNDDAPLYEVGSKIALDIIRELRGESIPDVVPIEFPLRSLHRFGGFARMMWPGKLVYIAGISGGGKTSMGETISELLQQDGHDVVWYNPEWSAHQMRIRALQRQGGLNMTQYGEMLVHNIDARNGMERRRGRGLTPYEVDENVERMTRVMAWPGDVYTLRQCQELSSMEAICQTVEKLVTTMRAAGRKVSAFFFDYIQRAPKSRVAGWDQQEWVVSQIKSLCERLGLFGFVFVQPTKGASKQTRSGDMLTEASGQGLSDQQANLYITMTPAFDEDGDKRPYTRITIAKNSMGMSGKLNLKWSYQLLTIVDEEISEDYIRRMGWSDEDTEDHDDD